MGQGRKAVPANLLVGLPIHRPVREEEARRRQVRRAARRRLEVHHICLVLLGPADHVANWDRTHQGPMDHQDRLGRRRKALRVEALASPALLKLLLGRLRRVRNEGRLLGRCPGCQKPAPEAGFHEGLHARAMERGPVRLQN